MYKDNLAGNIMFQVQYKPTFQCVFLKNYSQGHVQNLMVGIFKKWNTNSKKNVSRFLFFLKKIEKFQRTIKE